MNNKIHVTVYTDRNHVGKLTVLVDDAEVAAYEVAAQADNDAHPGIGYYEIINTQSVPADNTDAISAYGPDIIYLIQKDSTNQADVIVIHGGDTDEDGRLLPTEERGLRLSNEDLAALLANIDDYGIKELELEEKPLGFFKHFTTRRVSQRRPRYIDPNTYASYSSHSISDSPFFWMWLFDHNTASSDIYHHAFTGFGNGSSGGAGASSGFNVQGDPLIIDPFKEPEVKHTHTPVHPTQTHHTPVQHTHVPPVNMAENEPLQQSFESQHPVSTSTSY